MNARIVVRVLPMCLLLPAACSKPSAEQKDTKGAALAAPATPAPGSAAATPAAPAAPAAAELKTYGSCVFKASSQCQEYLEPDSPLFPDHGHGPTCKEAGGVFKEGATPCSAEGRLGTCEIKSVITGRPVMKSTYYKGAYDPAGMCGAMEGKWEPAPSKQAPAPAKKTALR